MLTSLLSGEEDMEHVASLIIFTTVNSVSGNYCQKGIGSKNAQQEKRIFGSINGH